ncbi:hypothetical protein D9Q98_000553 [Chlorella vulgaris]|uniref:Protein HIRA n=1 Tax=Chlorella vulgaris TaxID=3077 RepID=A0A9D4Z1Y1_CHLVU|nr:hypothetical protein D9Q98_000553 [Chlorella vulgaris]
MLVEKVPWCTHEGGVYTIHVQASGLRFATGGADGQVKVWSMAAVVDVQKEKAGPLVLATLSDHSSTVNAVRFSKNGRYLASGSDDRMVCVFEHKPGPGGSTLGGASASIENWRNRFVLRGHGNNVVDLGWSPDDSLLASASLDNMVHIWDAGSGHHLRTLDYHTSFVKGLAWDPVGTYLATQSEDKSVVIWRCDDWSVVECIKARYARLVTSTFSTRMSWSPDGTYLATGNCYQGACHAAVIIPRGHWNEQQQHMLISGHQGCVVSVGFNPRLFHLPKKDGAPGEVQEKLSSVFALGAQDKRISVWAAAQHTPIMVGKRFFKNQVTDVAWSPDGYTAFACSSDGTVACFQFAPSELGTPNTAEELESIFQQLYGSSRGAPGKRLVPESADLLALEAAAAATAPTVPEPATERHQAAPAAATPPAAVAAAPPEAAAAQQAPAPLRAVQPSAKQSKDALLKGRLGGGSEAGFDAPAAPAAADAAGRKRVAAEPVGQATAAAPAVASPRPTSAELMPPPEPKRRRAEPIAAAAAAGPGSAAGGRLAAGAAAGPLLAAGAAPAVVSAPPHVMLRGPEVPAEVTADLGTAPRLFEDPSSSTAAAPRRQLRISNRERAGTSASALAGGGVQAEVVCQQGRDVLWSDTLRGAAVAACGTHNFAAVGLADGQLLLYSAAGRHMAAPLKLGAGIAALACDSAWCLLALTTSGTVRLFDAESLRSLLNASVAPLLEDGSTVLDARLSRMGVPLITLSNCRAYVWSADLDGWACVADESFATSQFVPLMSLANQGEISGLQGQVLRAVIPRTSLPGQQVRAAAGAVPASRAHLEASLSTSLALQSPQEYRRWLLAYARFLAEQGEAARLSEVCTSLLGPHQGAHLDGGGGDAEMADADAAAAAAAGEGEAWQPLVLGLPKRELLGLVLREMSRNRALQRTTQTYHDALTELERAAAQGAPAAAQLQLTAL